MRVQRRRSSRLTEGFTLVELLVTMVLSIIIVAVIYAAFTVQQKSYTAQDAVSEMQQNIRVAIMLMSQDIRMAGFDSSGGADAGFLQVQADALAFTADLNEDGDLNDAGENIAYYIYQNPAGIWTLGRVASDTAFADDPPLTENPVGSGHYEIDMLLPLHEPLAENIERLEFNYLDEDGNALPLPLTGSDLDDIIFIQISILARSSQPDPDFVNTQSYTTGSGVVWPAANDNFRRRLLITTVNCRNMGL